MHCTAAEFVYRKLLQKENPTSKQAADFQQVVPSSLWLEFKDILYRRDSSPPRPLKKPNRLAKRQAGPPT